mmetsp:Transcript_32017/g.73106  ORF Transcript_32017/g.73106 Transcript_32017/m.73106 type:complete len:270 (+) Transcript_32017:79-888(+)
MRRIKNLFFGGTSTSGSHDSRKSPSEDPKAGGAAGDTAQEAALTWATKTEASRIPTSAGNSPGRRQPGNDRPPEQHGSMPKAHHPFVLQDAEDDDEIEIVYEELHDVRRASPTQMLRSAANGQEAPEISEERYSPMQPAAQPPTPLSRVQKEEAARLAESRKKFENQRLAAMQNDPEQPSSPSRSVPEHAPNADMVLGLNRDVHRENRANEIQIAGAGFLPGGVCDDELEAMMLPPSKTKRSAQDVVKEPGFDAADELLMKEILDNFES